MSHYCAADDCKVVVSDEMLMCGRHWRAVPAREQRAVYREYRRRGATPDSPLTEGYLDAVTDAVRSVRANTHPRLGQAGLFD